MKKPSKRNISFIVAWSCLILAMRCEAQQGGPGSRYSLPTKLVFVINSDWSSHGSDALKPAEAKTPLNPMAAAPIRVLSADYYIQNFGFFCKRELEFEKKTHVPLKFRLGSLDYVNRLEGK
jgi:hypothetical protein